MAQKALNFQENDSIKGAFKSSHVGSLFSLRKGLLDPLPMPKKGLVFPEMKLQMGKTPYSFKTDAVADKISCKDKDKGVELTARYKKTTGVWDVSMRHTVCGPVTVLTKYEERGETHPIYVFGADCVYMGAKANFKYNYSTGFFKFSGLYDLASVLEGAKLAADWKVNTGSRQTSVCNVACAFTRPSYQIACCFNNRGLLTLSKSVTITPTVTAGAEIVQATSKDDPAKNPLTLAVSVKVDKDHTLRTRINKAGHLNVALTKNISDNTKLMISTLWNVFEPKGFLQTPAFGFKIVVS